MKKLLALILSLIFALSLSACGESESKTKKSTDDYYENGIELKANGDYDKAVSAFEKAIEDDETDALSYLELADIYIRKNEFKNAYDILKKGYEITESHSIEDKLLDFNSANVITDSDNLARGKSHFTGDTLDWYHIYCYDEAGTARSAVKYCLGDGTEVSHIDISYNEKGQPLTSYAYYTDGVIEKVEFSYNDKGQLASTKEYNADGTLNAYSENSFDSDGYKIGETQYYANGTEHWSLKYEHNVAEKSTVLYTYFGGKKVGTTEATFQDNGYTNSSKSQFQGASDREISYTFCYEGFHEREEWIGEGNVRTVCYLVPLSELY